MGQYAAGQQMVGMQSMVCMNLHLNSCMHRGKPDKSKAVTAMAVTQKGGVVAVGRPGGQVDILHATDGTLITTIPGGSDNSSCSSLAFIPCSSKAQTAG